jgi:hypothetical protein
MCSQLRFRLLAEYAPVDRHRIEWHGALRSRIPYREGILRGRAMRLYPHIGGWCESGTPFRAQRQPQRLVTAAPVSIQRHAVFQQPERCEDSGRRVQVAVQRGSVILESRAADAGRAQAQAINLTEPSPKMFRKKPAGQDQVLLAKR